MARWDFALELSRDSGTPLFLQIARAITDEIRRGRLRPGDRLPGSRTLARTLGVQRGTVQAGLDELMAQGWIVTEPASGTFVSPELPVIEPRSFGARARRDLPDRFLLDLPDAPPAEIPYRLPPGALFFAPNRPDLRLAPRELLGRAYRRALRDGGEVLLGYGNPQGHRRLREAIADMLSSTRGLAAGAEHVLVTRGSQMGLALLARALLRPGDVVAVEELGYRPAVEAFRHQVARVVPLPLDRDGVRIEPLEDLARRGGLRAVHLTPHHQFPTAVTLSAGRRLRLLDLAARHCFAVFEEDYDHEFHYDGRPVLPLASADRHGVVAYLGTFSKVIAPALRIGYVVAPSNLIEKLVGHRIHLDIQGDRVLENALAGLIEEGAVQRHARRVRREYQARRDLLADELRGRLGGALEFEIPSGGIGLWARAAEGLEIDVLALAAGEAATHFGRHASFWRWQRRLTGAVLIALGLRLAWLEAG